MRYPKRNETFVNCFRVSHFIKAVQPGPSWKSSKRMNTVLKTNCWWWKSRQILAKFIQLLNRMIFTQPQESLFRLFNGSKVEKEAFSVVFNTKLFSCRSKEEATKQMTCFFSLILTTLVYTFVLCMMLFTFGLLCLFPVNNKSLILMCHKFHIVYGNLAHGENIYYSR